MPKVSVIISTFNQEQYIQDAIESVLAQTYKDYELFVIDDGSTDGTAEVVKRYNGRLTYVHKKNGGVSSARNTGIMMAQGEYVAFLDGDDMWLPEKLEKQLKAMDAPGIGLVHTSKYIMDKTGKLTGEIRPQYPAVDLKSLVEGGHTCMSVMVKKEYVVKAGLFDETMYGSEDIDLWIRVLKYTNLTWLQEPLIKYRVHGKNASTDFEKIYACQIKTLQKVLNDKDIQVPVSLKKMRLAQGYYLLAKTKYLKGFYREAFGLLLKALSVDLFLCRSFITGKDSASMKIRKIINPLAALVIYAWRALCSGKTLYTTEPFTLFLDYTVKKGLFKTKDKLIFRSRQTFNDMDFDNKKVLEIGCGDGVYSIWAKLCGAKYVIGLEPEVDGSTPGSSSTFVEMISLLKLTNIECLPLTIEQFDGGGMPFDMVFSNMSINHWDEQACMELDKNKQAQEIYLRMFKKIRSWMNDGATLVLLDNSNKNFSWLFGKRSPFCRQINWLKHQSPEVWVNLLREAGFRDPKVLWPWRYSFFGMKYCPRFISFFLDSFFRIEMKAGGRGNG